MLNFFLMGVGFQLFFGSLFIKAWRVWLIFANADKMHGSVLPNPVILAMVGGLVLLEVIYMIIWAVVDPMKPTSVDVSGSDYQYMIQCRSDSDGWLIAWVAEKGIMLSAGVLLATKTKNMRNQYNETKYIAMSIYIVFLVCCLCIPLAFILRTFPNTSLVIEGFGLLISMTGLITVLFAGMIIRIMKGVKSGGSSSGPRFSTVKATQNSSN
eukprot:TRINITY_DN3565_c0_g1_i2.p1 TRINITY_DN3565_c0_g1~~TRINITY_DN3565_c0_g1_i2.p1  ORF type:complete len:211 (+),score=47.54 TRINITY_DN3565_c0_g1_i2:114-746(+)